MPVDTRIAVNQMVTKHGAQPDDITWGPYDEAAYENDWVDDDEGDDGALEPSHEGGEYGDSARSILSEYFTSRCVFDVTRKPPMLNTSV